MNVKPTRSELMKLKKKIKLAISGHKLLKKKRDGLILEFFEILKKTKTVREELEEKYKEAQEKINYARLLNSDQEIISMSLAVKTSPEITVEKKNIMGVVVPKISTERKGSDKGFGVVSSSIAVREAVAAYEDLIEHIILVAEVETSLKKLLEEIDSTKRRVNALEHDLIPRMNSTKKFIELRLEEQERETIFRTKRIKKGR
ncbi:V-type ATP synthase subunit D [Candidatus Woesearchaeota archaeon]|nr:V-type ATP synthase subunit D [Candidatus Woesearchaeota archaeon]